MISKIYNASECKVSFKYNYLFYCSLLNNFQIYKKELCIERLSEPWKNDWKLKFFFDFLIKELFNSFVI